MMLHRLLSVAPGLRTLVGTSSRLLFGFRCLLTYNISRKFSRS